MKIVFERPQNEDRSQLTHIQISNILFIEDFLLFYKELSFCFVIFFKHCVSVSPALPSLPCALPFWGGFFHFHVTCDLLPPPPLCPLLANFKVHTPNHNLFT